MGGAGFESSKAGHQGFTGLSEVPENKLDQLTGLPVIGHFFQAVPGTIRDLKERGKIPAVLWISFVGLREYNALHGFESGDSLIIGLASLIGREFGVERTARYGDDYFVTCTGAEQLEERLRHFFDEVSKLNHGNSRPAAVGIYVMNEEASPSAAVDRAKLAHDSLHDLLKSSFAYYGTEIKARAELRRYLLQNCQKAMDEDWIQPYYQPVVRSITGKLCGAEALCRWKDPVYGMISPGEFIPVMEEEGLISSLDLYMLERVCRDGQDLIRTGKNIVPISVNLSRKDFLDAEIVEKIEALAKKYEIPRELLNIEITESALIRHAERLKRFIAQFHGLGFHVWMDDFGTGYSSLGSLKDLQFDELKIDMSFLSDSTDRARSIVRSIVRMAKEIGVQTLAEGVETEEQYKFLKEIGCEKIQGYYFGKPMDRDSFRKHCQEQQFVEEEFRKRNYYDALSRINYQTDEPLCVIEDDGSMFHLLFANEAYRAVLRRDNVVSIEDWISEINENNNPAHDFHRRYADEQLRKLQGPQVLSYPSGDHYMELTGRVVTRYENFYVYALNICYIQLDAISEDEKKAGYIQYIYYLCNDIAVVGLDDNYMYGLKSSDSSQPIRIGGSKVDLLQTVRIYTEEYVYAPDQERYRQFLNPDHLKQEIRKNHGQERMGFFRSLTVDGKYRWMLHVLMPIPNSDFDKYLLITLPVEFDKSFLRTLRNIYDGELRSAETMSEKPGISPSLLWSNLEAYSDGMYFWKDINRRFLGASRSFLDYYGFKSENDIIGKTDEDMNWHIEPMPFMKDELDVLNKGKTVSLVKGKCIARGTQRTIMASKIPVYRDGEIVGLMGTFFDVEELEHYLNNQNRRVTIDDVTDLLNLRGIMESMKDYLEALWNANREFLIIHVSVPEYSSFCLRYGEKAGNLLLRRLGEILRKAYGRRSTIGRLTGGYFMIVTQNVDLEQNRMEEENIRKDITRLRRIGEWQCALTADVRITTMNQQNASREIYAKNVNQMFYGLSGGLPENT